MVKKVSKILLIIMVILLVLVCGFTFWVRHLIMTTGDESQTGYNLVDSGAFIRSETVYVLLIFFAALILMVFMTIVVFLIENRSYKKKKNSKLPMGKRFNALKIIDDEFAKKGKAGYDNNLELSQICDNFRDFSAAKLGLYYELDDIRGFVAGLGVSKLVIMQGLSGTGKTSLATAFGEFLHKKSVVVSIQPMWKERSDMLGYYNEFTKKFNESTFLKALYEARYTDDICIVVLDEMNIARVEYYFADFLSQLELAAANRYIEIVSDQWGDDPALIEEGKLRIPENVWFVGTANNDDSTFAISDKVYDRAMLINLNKKSEKFSAMENDGVTLSYSYLSELFEKAMAQNSISEDSKIKLKKMDDYLISYFQITYGNRMTKQLEEYVSIYEACGGSEIEAIDDFFSKKILRKLESLSPVVLKNASEGLYSLISDLFGDDKMVKSKTHLKQLGRF